jgi:hypothetical protein
MVYASIDDSSKWSHWPDTMDELFARRVYQPLPPKHEAQSLCRDYFENFNCIFPLFHEPTFDHLLEAQYAGKPAGGSGWWASLNVVLAMAQRLRVMSRVVSKEEDRKSWGYIKNAMGVQTELTMRNTDLLSVQAILGLVRYPCLWSSHRKTDQATGSVLARNPQSAACLLLGRGGHAVSP